MLYFYVFVIGFFGALSGNFTKHGEKNIGQAGGPENMILINLFGPALVIGLITGFTPYLAIAFVGFYIDWLEALYSFFVILIAAFICGFIPFNVRHIFVCFSPILIGWSFYEIWIF